MTEERSDADDRLRQALHRYAERVQPLQGQWARIEARHRIASRAARPRRRGVLSISLTAAVAAVMVIAAGVVVRPLGTVRPPNAEADFVEPRVPQYAGVVRAPDFLPGSTMAAIRARGYIRVGIKFDQPYFGYRDQDGAVHGFDAEIAKLLAVGVFGGKVSDIDDRIHWVQAVSRNRETLLQAGSVDIIVATYTINDARREKVDFAGPYYVAHQDIMVRSDSTVRSFEDLTGKRVCTAQGSTSYENLILKNPNTQPVQRDTYSECATALEHGEVEAVTTDRDILSGYVHQANGVFRILNIAFSDEPYGIGVAKGDMAFRAFLNDRLAAVEANGDWARAARYSLSNVDTIPPPITVP
jgi:glutamate transport system substrate-binding protein